MQHHTIRRSTIRSATAVIITVVVSFALVGSASAHPCDPPPQLEYVAMGDSYSSGFGLDNALGDCSRSDRSYPRRLQARRNFGTFVDVTCSGAQTKHWTQAQSGNIPQLDALSADTDIVTFTIGGNDLGFSDIVTNCMIPVVQCRGDYGGDTMPELLAKVETVVGPNVENAIRQTLDRAPNAQVFVLGYMDLLPAGPTGALWPLSCGATGAAINDKDRTALRGVQRKLNEEIEARTNAIGGRAHYVDVFNPSIGHDLCASDNWTSGLATLYHPNANGYEAMTTILDPVVSTTLGDACAASTTTTTTTTTLPSTTTTTQAGTTTTTVPSQTDTGEAFVRAAYQDYIGRQPTASELQAGLAAVGDASSPAKRSAFSRNLSRSTVYVNAFLNRLYDDTLGRNGDPGGLDHWRGKLLGGAMTPAEVGADFYASGEYFRNIGGGTNTSWVTDLYGKLLLRAPDSQGLAHWVGIAESKGRTKVSHPMYQSRESSRKRVEALYRHFLGRGSDTAGLDHWGPRIIADGDLVLAQNLTTSTEYLTKAVNRYP